jgi:hypothetical protein
MPLPVSAWLPLSETAQFIMEHTGESEDRVRAALTEAGLTGAISATGCLHLSSHPNPARYFAHPALGDRVTLPPEAWGTAISWRESRIGRYDLVRLNRAHINRWLVTVATNAEGQPREESPPKLRGTKSKSKMPSLNNRKRAAVLEAIEALGREYLSKLSQKEREPAVIAKVAAQHNNLKVSDRYVRDIWNNH